MVGVSEVVGLSELVGVVVEVVVLCALWVAIGRVWRSRTHRRRHQRKNRWRSYEYSYVTHFSLWHNHVAAVFLPYLDILCVCVQFLVRKARTLLETRHTLTDIIADMVLPHTDTQTHRHTQTARQTNRHPQTDTQTDTHTDSIHTRTDRHTHR